jgi:alpha-L-fucosidase
MPDRSAWISYFSKACMLLLLLALQQCELIAQQKDYIHTETKAEKDRRMEWWRNAKFGMFIHWGLYAMPAGEYKGKTNYGEWIMQEAKIPVSEYEKFAGEFNPEKFNADDWVLMAKNAGMKYIVITSKHHDGFCLWDSKVGDYDITGRTPFKRDVLKELSDACKKYNVKFCLYHSIMDWHHPDENKMNFARYRDEYLKPQLKELITRYDPAVLWFDGEWINEWTEEQGKELYNWLRNLKPDLIINNRVGKGRNGMEGMAKNGGEKYAGDFGTPEQQVLNEKNNLDWESCMTMNNHWGYNKYDQHWKTAGQLIWHLSDIVAKGGNYLLNVGPTAQGLFPDSSIERLKEIGEWMKVNKEAIYGTKTWSYFSEGDNIRYARNNKGEVFVYCKGWPEEKLLLKKIKPLRGTFASLLGLNKKFNWKTTEEGTIINLPHELTEETKRPCKYVYVFKIKGMAQQLAATPQIGTDAEAASKSKVIAGEAATVKIQSKEKNAVIHFTTDGSLPVLQSATNHSSIPVAKSGIIKAVAYVPGKMPSEISELKIVKGKYAISISTEYATQYAAFGPVTLADGFYGDSNDFHKDWLGFEGKNLEAVIDLGAIKPFQSVEGSFLRNHGQWIFLPVKMSVWISDDNSKYQLLGETNESFPQQMEADEKKVISLRKASKARYIKVIAQNIGRCPSWHPGAGGKAWIFCDEITIE